MSTQLISQKLADFANKVELSDIPEKVKERAKYLILDAVGIAYASTNYDFTYRTMVALSELQDGEEPVIGSKVKLSMRDAAVMNGFLIHGLDFDDTHVRGVIHATASCFPAALGVASNRALHGKDILLGYILGMEVATRLGMVAKGGFHQVGFHPTGVVGTFASALIAGRLMQLTSEQLVMAQGIALSLASGSLEFLQDGAWTKRMHPGWSAASGMTAATFARHGFKGPFATYEGRFGLFNTYLGTEAGQADLTLATEGLGEEWEVANVAVKPLPACHFTHACADSAMELRKKHNIDINEIDSVLALVPQEVIKTVCEPQQYKKAPQNSYDAQFSIPYAVASGLARGHFGLAALEEQALREPEVLALASKVQYQIDPNSRFPKYYSGEVIVKLKSGEELRWREDMNRGAADRPLSNEDIVEKFLGNMLTVVSAERAHQVKDLVLSMDTMEGQEFSKQLASN
ncbi:MAG: MmgE/PrpD family protein [Alcaligenaceae bacterium]|nr:MmgE/PrpD family protein [Alcaligenaceae bacterium]